MSGWEKKILDAFISHYFASVSDSSEDPENKNNEQPQIRRRLLRLRATNFFPDFETAHHDEKESYLEAAEALERKGLVQLRWEKWGEGERLKTLSCYNFELLFKEAGKPFPETEAEKIRTMLGGKSEKKNALLEYLAQNFSPREIGLGLDMQTMEDFAKFLEFMVEPSRLEKLTTRSLSILLYRDSKRLEDILSICKPLWSRRIMPEDKSVPFPDFSFLERSYPETMISGKIIITFNNSKPPMINSGGHILGFPLESAEETSAIELIQETQSETEGRSGRTSKNVLTIENKETFYALGSPQKNATLHSAETSKNLSHYDCFLYIGGYSNRATAALIKTLAASGFTFYHAGDLDPDGVLILQQIQDLAGKPVSLVRMDAATFDEYQAWGRTLTKPMLRQIEKIREETKTIPGIAGLLQRIKETGLGVEQEIIDYR